MSESTEELKTAVQGLTETLTEAVTNTELLSSQGTELAEEAAGHGWHGISTRMQEAADALQVAADQLHTGKEHCETATDELGLINDKIPAEEVRDHLTTSTSELEGAVNEVKGAVEKVDEAKAAAEEIGQQGMMQATLDLHNQLTELQDVVAQHQATSESERVDAETYVDKQVGN